MIPLGNLDDIHRYWTSVRRPQTVLHGYFLYAGSDHRFPEYMTSDGMGDLDLWTGDECGIFVFQAPPEGWARHAVQTNNEWARLVEQRYGPEISARIVAASTDIVITLDGRQISLKDLFAGCADSYLQRDLIEKVLKDFKLPTTAHPCMIFFTDLYGAEFWEANLDDLLNKSEGDLRLALKGWFGSPIFVKLMKEARRARAA